MSSRIVIKRNLIIFRDPEKDWNPIRKRLIKEHGQSIVLTYVMRKRLGFSTRYHVAWITGGDKYDNELTWKYPEEQIHLDFFSESAQSWFQLRYLNL